MISIVVVNWNSYDWLDLLLESLERFTTTKYNVIVVDNSLNPKTITRSHVQQIVTGENIGHGAGLNLGASKAENLYTMFLDVDSHILCHNWDTYFLRFMKTHDLLAGKGVKVKPIRPACMFMKTEIAKKYDWQATPGYKGHRITPMGMDVAIPAYHQIVTDGVPKLFLESQRSIYGTLNGEEWCVEGKRLIYHHWHGSHLIERQVDFPNNDLLADKKLLFSKIPWRTLS